MAITAGAIRAGAAYAEIGADDRPLTEALARSQARLRQWAADNSRGVTLTRGTEGGVLAGEGGEAGGLSGKWAQSIARGAGLTVAIHTAIGAASAGLAMMRGDWDKVQASIRSVPLLGSAASDLADLFDDLFLGIRANIAAMKKRVAEEVRQDEVTRQSAGSIGQVAADWRRRAGLVGASPAEKETAGIRDEAAKAIESIRADLAKAGTNLNDRFSYLAATARRAVADIKAGESKALAEVEGRPAEDAAKKRERAEQDTRKAVARQLEDLADKQRQLTWSAEDYAAWRAVAAGATRDEVVQIRLGVQALDRLDVAKRAAEARAAFGAGFAASLEDLANRLREVRGEIDGLGLDQERALAGLVKAFAQGTIQVGEFSRKTEELKRLYADLRKAQDEAAAKREGESLAEAMRTPEERARAGVGRYKELLAAGAIGRETYDRAVRRAVEEAAAAMPETVRRATIGVRGTFSAAEAAGLATGGTADRMVKAAEDTARNTKAIALAAELGVVFTP